MVVTEMQVMRTTLVTVGDFLIKGSRDRGQVVTEFRSRTDMTDDQNGT